MTQENKELLLKDLCARFPYGVKCKDVTLDFVGTALDISMRDNMCKLFDDYGDNYTCFMMNCKPYLFPMSSMAEKQKKEYYNLCIEEEKEEIEFGEWITRVYYHNTIESIDWLNKHHLDYRGLIEKELAIDATNLNIY